MITLEQLKIYNRYDGDMDMWTRTGKSSEKKLMTSDDWYLIDNLIQDIAIAKNGPASEKVISNLKNRLSENCDNADTIKQLESL